MGSDNKLAVVAIGGNALIRDQNHQTIPDQYEAAADHRSGHHRYDRGRMERDRHPRQRPADGVHPAALGTLDP